MYAESNLLHLLPLIFADEFGILPPCGATAARPAPTPLHACQVSYGYWSAGERMGDAGVAGFAASLISDPYANNPNGEAARWTDTSTLEMYKDAFLTGREDALFEMEKLGRE